VNRYPKATWRPGPEWKTWGATNAGAGAILHSMEGYEAGAWGVLDSMSQASWHFSVMRDGRVFQHYDLNESCWHAGGKASNERLLGIEHEGRTGEPFTEAQIGASVALVRWIAAEQGWTPERGVTLLEHREAPGANTTCPNGRVPWERYKEDDVQIRQLDQAESIAALNKAAEVHGKAINDNNGFTVVEVVQGSPVPLAPGQRAYLFVTN